MRRVAAAAGLVAPVFFAVVLFGLTAAQYAFMRSLGWDPVVRPTFDWPSGLALGPLGWLMTATFLISGALIAVFAAGLGQELANRSGETGSRLMICSGVAMMGLAFTTDPTLSHAPATWHGRLHDLSFVVLGVTLIPAMLLLAIAFGRFDHWRNLSRLTWLASALAVPTFAFKGVFFYAFLLGMLVWNEAVALQLYRSPAL